MKKMKEIRLYNISCRYSEANKCYEMLKYYPNDLYGKKSDYIFDKDKKMYYPKSLSYKDNPCVWISPTVFDRQEFCYTLSMLRIDKHNLNIKVEEVCQRVKELSSDEKSYYDNILHLALDVIPEYEEINTRENGK